MFQYLKCEEKFLKSKYLFFHISIKKNIPVAWMIHVEFCINATVLQIGDQFQIYVISE